MTNNATSVLAVEKFTARSPMDAVNIFGQNDEHLNAIADSFGVVIEARATDVIVRGHGKAPKQVCYVLDQLAHDVRSGVNIAADDVQLAIRRVKGEGEGGVHRSVAPVSASPVVVATHKGKQIRAKTDGQRIYVDAIRKNGVTFGIGPAGTGKTYLAIALAVAAFKGKEVEKIILTRPAVEAGEKLGFLPGDMQQKVDPYLRPLYDALYDMVGADGFEAMLEKGQVEVAPLAFMRGRTLDRAFVILDEAQNTTVEQMKMFLTRMGFGSKMVVTGDPTQIDLPAGTRSGLVDAQQTLADVHGIAMSELKEADVVRHEMVARIIRAYANSAAGQTQTRK